MTEARDTPQTHIMNEAKYRWYLSAQAVRDYIDISGLTDDDGGKDWLRAERELGAHADAAREAGHNEQSTIYRTGRVRVGDRPKSTRLEMFVRHTQREEGSLPQLVAVRDKGGGNRSSRGVGKQFTCPKCGSHYFGRDIGTKDGVNVPLPTVRCHGRNDDGRGCDWHDKWP